MKTKQSELAPITLTTKDIETLVAVAAIPERTPPAVIEFFGRVCADSKLSPFKKQVHLIRRGDKYTIQTSIDGYRTIADRTNRYCGSDDPTFGPTDKNGYPESATVTVWKLVGNVRCPFTATARWKEYFPGEQLGFMWKKMPFLMIGKCAEALALRKAFPEETSGIYIEDEMTMETEIPIVRAKIVDSSGSAGDKPSPDKPDAHKTPPAAAQPKKKSGESATNTSQKSIPRLKPLEQPKADQSPFNSFGPNESQVLNRLETMKKERADFVRVIRAFNVIDADEQWSDVNEGRFEICLEPNNWKLIEAELKK